MFFCPPHQAMGTDEDALSEIIGTRTKEALHDIKHAYQILFDCPLITAVKGETSGFLEDDYYSKFLLRLLSGSRDEAGVAYPEEQAVQHASAILESTARRLALDGPFCPALPRHRWGFAPPKSGHSICCAGACYTRTRFWIIIILYS